MIDFFDGLAQKFEYLKKKLKDSPWWSKWFWYVVVGIFAVLLAGGLIFNIISKSEKAAKAMHERDVLLEKAKLEEVNAEVSQYEKQKTKHAKKAEKYKEKAQKLRVKIVDSKAHAIQSQQIIDKLKGWDDVENNIKY